jgi:hypothetical protein
MMRKYLKVRFFIADLACSDGEGNVFAGHGPRPPVSPCRYGSSYTGIFDRGRRWTGIGRRWTGILASVFIRNLEKSGEGMKPELTVIIRFDCLVSLTLGAGTAGTLCGRSAPPVLDRPVGTVIKERTQPAAVTAAP